MPSFYHIVRLSQYLRTRTPVKLVLFCHIFSKKLLVGEKLTLFRPAALWGDLGHVCSTIKSSLFYQNFKKLALIVTQTCQLNECECVCSPEV